MKYNKIKIAFVLALTLIVLSVAQAQPREFQSREKSFFLDLSEDQQEQINALRIEHYKTMKPLRNKMAELKARERTLISEETVDMKAINRVIDDQTELMNKIRKLQVEHRLSVREILIDEQLMNLDQRCRMSGRRNLYMNAPEGPRHPGRYRHKRMG